MNSKRKVMQGRVVSDKMQKTVVVEVESLYTHPLYGKVVRRVRRFMAHNEAPVVAQLGDLVKIVESRPYSRHKRWRVSEIVQRGVVVEAARDEKELEELRAKEEAERAARRAEEERRAAERLARLAGEEISATESPTPEVVETEAA